MKSLFVVLGFLLASLTVQADDFDAGKFIADKCSSCHGSEVYTRPDRRVKDLQQLGAQVRRCDANVGSALFDEDMEAVIQYLNTTYYKF